jgi:hypothetical protein
VITVHRDVTFHENSFGGRTASDAFAENEDLNEVDDHYEPQITFPSDHDAYDDDARPLPADDSDNDTTDSDSSLSDSEQDSSSQSDDGTAGQSSGNSDTAQNEVREDPCDSSYDEENVIINGKRSRNQTQFFGNPVSHNWGAAAHHLEVEPADTDAGCVQWEDAIRGENRQYWERAAKDELNSLEKHETWVEMRPEDVPRDVKPLGSRFLCKIKTIGSEDEIPKDNTWVLKKLPDGSLQRFKVRLIIQGYRQKQGIDFTETFAPVSRPEVLRMLLAMSNEDPEADVEQIDIVTAFLYGNLSETIYMNTPTGANLRSKIVKLLKALYGLKQAPRAWHSVIDTFLVSECGFVKAKSTPCLYSKTSSGKKVIVSLYVDDLTIVGNSKLIQDLKAKLKSRFNISELGSVRTCLGLQVERDVKKGTLFIHQSRYLDDLLKKTGMSAANPAPTPALQNCKLTKLMCPNTTLDYQSVKDSEKKLKYRSVVSSLLWLLQTRPDIAHAVGAVSRFVSNPGPSHYLALKRILRYLKGTSDFGMFYRRSNIHPQKFLAAYSDSDWAQNADDRRSTSGYVVMLNGNVISCKSKAQSCVALSSCEAETVAICLCAQELVFLRSVLQELGYSQTEPTVLFCDNTGAIAFTKDGANHSKMKHISLRQHYVRDLVSDEQVKPVYVPTDLNLADIFTKALGPVKFQGFRKKLRVLSRSSLPASEGANQS